MSILILGGSTKLAFPYSIAVMIMAIVTRVLAPAGQWPGRLHWPRLLQLLAAACWASAMSGLGRSQAPAPTLISFGRHHDRLLLSIAPGQRDRRALEIVDLACVKIDQPQPWTPATLRLGRSHRTDVPRIVLLPGASAGLGCVPGVAAFRRPGLVAVLAVVPQP
jgi:hypothetical protein